AIGIDGGQTNQPDVAAEVMNRPVPTRLLRQAQEGSSVCLVHAQNGLGIPGKALVVGDERPVTGRDGCVSRDNPDEQVSFEGDGSAQPAPGVEDPPGGAPRGVHLSFTGDPRTTVAVTWFTSGLEDPGSSVAFGRPGPEGCEDTLLVDQVEGLATRAPGVEVLTHEGHLSGLEPGSRVCYRVGGLSGWSAVQEVRTADDGPFTFTAFGDHGRSEFSRRNTAALAALRPDFHLIAGDLSYANGVQPIWDTWFGELEPLASQVPVMAALGNHEVEDGFGTEAFRNRLAHPGAELYYSFDYANVHFLVVDGGAALEEGILPAELAFVEQDLADASRRRAAGEIDFIIAVQHFPLWSNHDSRGPCDAALVAVEEQIFQRHQVDIVLVGHNHHYERSKPMAYGQPTTQETTGYTDPAGIIQIITGGGGVSLYNFVAPGDFATWSAAYARRYHYTRFDVSDDLVTVTAIATDGPVEEVLDTFTLRAGDPGSPQPATTSPNPCP
ncbi:MAG TPA: metallophosphoesterase family protein, partial [Actinomycetota bacterium]